MMALKKEGIPACGTGGATCAPDVFRGFVSNAAVDAAVRAFVDDFEKLTDRTSMCDPSAQSESN